MRPFANEPVLELRRGAVREALPSVLAALDAKLPLELPVIVSGASAPARAAGLGGALAPGGAAVPGSARVPEGAAVRGGAPAGGAAVPGTRARGGVCQKHPYTDKSAHTPAEPLLSVDPCEPARVVARAAVAGVEDVERAVAAGAAAAEEWAARTAGERAEVLVAAAAWMRERRLELAALQLRECAKPWPEADADVCEAIDFLEYYAREAVRLEQGELLQAPGERNSLRWVGRGVAAVISPWNFPLAIPCGMTSAALVMGNAVVLKPAEQSPASALMLWSAFDAAGLPGGLLSLLPGFGDVGAALVCHPGVQTIAFTGSLPVGQEIWRAAASSPPAAGGFKRVVAELGGKNCVIVDADADLDEVVPALVASAFGYAGQKCSAASRVLVHEAIFDALERRLGGAVRSVVVGPADDLATQVPALIEQAARERVEGHIADAARVVAQAPAPADGEGFYCPATVVADLPPDSPTLREEVFGPLLSLERVSDVEEAIEVVRSLPFALTGGLFARDPATVVRVASALPVGNLYVNRPITGAMVGRQPFGGNRQSGTGIKAGGPGYLEQFADQHVISENTVRHGLVV